MSLESQEKNKTMTESINKKSDLYRETLLNHYMKFWGEFEFQVVSTRACDNTKIEVFYFPATGEKLAHVATIGLFFQILNNGRQCQREYFFTLADDLGGESIDKVFNYLLDICAHTVTKEGELSYPSVTSANRFCPEKWKPKAILIDEPRGESEDFSLVDIKIGQCPEILWVVPIHQAECDFILAHGIESFDSICDSMEQSIVDVTRASFCS